MLKNYLKSSIRSLIKQKGFTAINIVGLTLGLCCSMLIFLWIGNEMKVDRTYPDGDRIYRVMFTSQFPNGDVETWESAPQPLEEVLSTEYPEIEHSAMVSWADKHLISYDERKINQSGIAAGKDFFGLFGYEFIHGDPHINFTEKNTMVITTGMAERLFGTDWQQKQILGEMVLVDQKELFAVKAVIKNPDKHASIQFDYVITFNNWLDKNSGLADWDWYSNNLFVKLRKDIDVTNFNKKVNSVILDHREQEEDYNAQAFVYPMERMHLYGKFRNGKNVGGRIEYIRLFGGVSIFVLILAAINFINLATARSFSRAKEVGLRKVVGAGKFSIISQFILESFLVTFAAMLLATLITNLLLPAFNLLSGKDLMMDFSNPNIWLIALAFLLITTLMSGFYPAFIVSGFKPAGVLKGKITANKGNGLLRKSLVVFQFFLSIFMLAGTMVVHFQVDYVMNRNLGIDRESILVYYLNQESKSHFSLLKERILQHSEFVSATTCDQNPINIFTSVSGFEWEGKQEGDRVEFEYIKVTHDFAETLGIEMVAGREFSDDFHSDSNAFVVNETAAKAMGLETPINARFEGFGREDGKIIGVVEDYYGASAYDAIEPLLLSLDPDPGRMYLRVASQKTVEAREVLESIHKEFSPNFPMEYHFLDEDYNRLYKSEMMMSKLSSAFAMLAILISCLGLIGLASLNVAYKVKEIGIRKALGASISNILVMLSKEYVRLIVIAFLISVPVINYFITDWLNKFEFKIQLSWWLYPLAGLFMLIIALLSVSWQSFKAAVTNPINSLRDD